MNAVDVEIWVRRVVSSVLAGSTVEDSRVELKRNVLDPAKAARRIAGHANASGGEEFLWILGVDEAAREVTGIDDETDPAVWWQSVEQWFESVVPTVADYRILVEEKTVLALLFGSALAPYVVKNPVFGSLRGEAVELETPWREGTRVRSARRHDLLRILAPIRRLPRVEVLDGSLKYTFKKTDMAKGSVEYREPKVGEHSGWELSLELYFVSYSGSELVFPAHSISVLVEESNALGCQDFSRYDPDHYETPIGRQVTSVRDRDLVIGTGKYTLLADFFQKALPDTPAKEARVRVHLVEAASQRGVGIHVEFTKVHGGRFGLKTWTSTRQ